MSSLTRTARNFLLAGTATALLIAAGSSSASAGAVAVTWDPQAVGMPNPYGEGPFSTDDITTAEYGSIVATSSTPSSTSFTNNGLVNLGAFSLAGSSTTPLALGRSNGYVLFATFTAMGSVPASTLIPAVGTSFTGLITSFTYTLYAAPASGGTPSFAANSSGATYSNVGGLVTLATGTEETEGTATITNTSGAGLSVGANILASFVEDPTAQADGFYISPPSSVMLDLFSSTTNTGSTVTNPDPNTIVIGADGKGGGGDITFQSKAVPEPASMALLGSGLLGLGLLRRQRAKK